MAIEGESVDKARARSRRTGRSKPSTARLGSGSRWQRNPVRR
jgi:hypothetical protein